MSFFRKCIWKEYNFFEVMILKYHRQNFAFMYIFVLVLYVKNESTMKGALKAKHIFMRESCNFKFHRNIMIFTLLRFKNIFILHFKLHILKTFSLALLKTFETQTKGVLYAYLSPRWSCFNHYRLFTVWASLHFGSMGFW